MSYNKSKHVEAAQKFLHQGKISQAIGEYQQMLKQEPKDQLTLMTIGDLFVRQGETFQALEYFERLAQIFLSEGFVSKAIAIYKKIAKLAPEETRPVERLAELYVQQGVLSEARPIYLQLAELHQRAGRQPQALALLRKLLDAEPDNLRVQVRLAELSLSTGAPAEAVAGFRAAAELLHNRGEHAEAAKYIDRALKIDPDDLPSVTLKALILAASSHRSDAIALLQSLPALDEGGDAAGMLIDFYLEAGEFDRATDLASRIFARNAQHTGAALRVAETLLGGTEPSRALPLLDLAREAATDAGQHEQLAQLLSRAAERLPLRIEPREWLVEFYGRISDSFRLPDALASLAEAYEAAGQHDRAQQVQQQILERNPEDETAQRNDERLRNKMGLPVAASQAPDPAPVETPAASPAEAALDEETQRFITQSLTDADLFSSYGLNQKAVELLGEVVARQPKYVPALERLLDIHLGEGDERRTAELAAELQQIHKERGDNAAAERFGELHRRFQRAAAASPAPAEFGVTPAAPVPPAPQEFQPPAPFAPADEQATIEAAIEELFSAGALSASDEGVVEAGEEAGAPEAEAAPESLAREDEAVHEVDLSEEWAALAEHAAESETATEAARTPAAPSEEHVEPPVAAQPAEVPQPNEDGVEEFFIEGAPEYELELEAPAAAEESAGDPLDADALDANDLLRALSSELESALPEVMPGMAAPRQKAPAQVQPEPAPPPAPEPEPAEIDPLFAIQPQPAQAAEREAEPEPVLVQAARQESSDGLSEMFEEFRSALDDITQAGEDLETHYNLGIAYREMGLVDEAISEFQKVAKAVKRGESFPYAMQCCTLLGLAFMEKSQPSIAAMWYERALEIPGLDQESVLALRYDLGVAQELAGDTTAARRSFSQVYGMNIDYRDVAERLAALGNGN